MVEFRCYCLNEERKIIREDSVSAADVLAAVKAARRLCQSVDGVLCERVEIWQGERRLYP